MLEGINSTSPQPPSQAVEKGLETLRQRILEREPFVTRICEEILYVDTGRTDLTGDMVNKTLMKAIEKSSQYDKDKGALDNWLFTIARNTIRDYYKTREYSQALKTDNMEYRHKVRESPNVEELVIQKEEKNIRTKAFNEAFARLSAKHKEVVLLDLDGLTVKEIAEKIRTSKKTAGNRLFSAKKKLIKLMGQDPDNLRIIYPLRKSKII